MRIVQLTTLPLVFALLAVSPTVAAIVQTVPIQAQAEADISAARVEAGRILLDDGVAGLQATLAEAGAPPMTFDQETRHF